MPKLKKRARLYRRYRKTLLRQVSRQSLTVKLAGAMVLVVSLIIGLGTILIMGVTKKAIAESSVTSALYQTQVLKMKLIEVMLSDEEKHESLNRVLGEDYQDSPSDEVNIFNNAGEIRFSTRTGNIGGKITRDLSHLTRLKADEAFTEFTSLDEAGRLRVVYPIRKALHCATCHTSPQAVGDWVGGIELFVPLRPIFQRLSLDRSILVMAGLGIMGLFSLLIRWLVHSIVKKPIRKLTDVMARASEGELDVRTHIGEDPDLGRLAETFNSMVRGIRFAQKRLEQQHRRELAQTNRLASLGMLLSNVSHEIKNPLASISSTLHALRPEFHHINGQEIFRELNLQIARIEETVNHLLRYARQAPAQYEKCRITDPIHQAFHLAEHRLSRSGIQFKIEAPRFGPFVWGDRGQLQQVFLNLFLNAAAAMQRRGTLAVRILERFGEGGGFGNSPSGGDGILVEVEDTGSGMGPDIASKVFEPFFTTKEGGTGLGMSVVKGIVEAHGGSIHLESTLGKGTVVRLFFPPHEAAYQDLAVTAAEGSGVPR